MSVVTTTPPTLGDASPRKLAMAWKEVEPNSDYRQTIAAALAEGDAWINELFAARLCFGTAGMRGPAGPGSGAMNQVLVRLVAAALADSVKADGGSHVVVGYDARHESDLFASDTARVLAARGVHATVIDRPTATPVLAFAVRHQDADAGVMVTASHNPRTDNGYKVYGRDGAPLTSLAAAELTERVLAIPLLSDKDLARESSNRLNTIGDELIDAYLSRILATLRPDGARSARVAYTPLHGVGADLVVQAFERAGFAPPVVVAAQAEPNGDFPTTAVPNPEEPGVLDLLVETATAEGATLALANDPDADRLAVAVPGSNGWQLLSGDDVGVLLADYLLRRSGAGPNRLVVNTIVSTRLLTLIAARHGVSCERTLTGFKSIMAAANEHRELDFVLGYEEALGYCIGDAVRDKDGVSAALVIAEYASDLEDHGHTLADELDKLHNEYGVHVSGQRSLRFEEGGPSSAEALQLLRANPPEAVAGFAVAQVDDLLSKQNDAERTDAIVLSFDDARLTIRPSGTEPKLKFYGEVWQEPKSADLGASRSQAHNKLTALLTSLSAQIADPERATFEMSVDRSPDDASQRALDFFGSRPEHLTESQALNLIVRTIDLTTLAGDDTPGRVRALCASARRPNPCDAATGPVAAVCVYPNLVKVAAELTAGSTVGVASVAGAFPSGLSSLDARLMDINDALLAGATEIDVVMNRSAFLVGDHARVTGELRAMRKAIGPHAMKVILETGELPSPLAIRQAAQLAIHAGADWIKTSTGKAAVGATPQAVLAMAQAVADHVERNGQPVGIKVSGGVRTTADALGYLAIIEATLGPAWLDPSRVRFGASGLLDAVVTDINHHVSQA